MDAHAFLRATQRRLFDRPFFISDDDRLRHAAAKAFASGADEDLAAFLHSIEGNATSLAAQLRGIAYRYLGKLDDAEYWIRQALAKRLAEGAPSHQVAASYVELASIAEDRGHRIQAFAALDEAEGWHPHYRPIHVNRFGLAGTDPVLQEQVLKRMQRVYPSWTTDPVLCSGLREDGVLRHKLHHGPTWRRMLRMGMTGGDSHA
jgi:hypothetical protein